MSGVQGQRLVQSPVAAGQRFSTIQTGNDEAFGAFQQSRVKLDCEGAEWPVLLTSRRLGLIREICGEFHEIGGQFLEINENRLSEQPVFSLGDRREFTIDALVEHLEDAGFSVNYRRHKRPTGALEGLGLFFATREPHSAE